ncbi:MAG: TRAP transporter small permease [Betaproteobacteria bacterium]
MNQPQAILARANSALSHAEDLFLSVSHGVIAVLVVAAVFFRYVLADPLTWTEEFIIIVFSWMLFIGFSSGMQRRMHIRIDALIMLLPPSGRWFLGAIAVAATLITLIALAWFGGQQAYSLLHTQTPMMRISAAWAASAIPVSAALAAIHVISHALEHGLGETLWPQDLTSAGD